AAAEAAGRDAGGRRAGPDRLDGDLPGGAVGLPGHRVLDRRGALGRHRRPPAHRDPGRPAPGRLAAAVLPAAARLDGARRRQRDGDPRAIAAVRAAERARCLVGAALPVRRARRLGGGRPAGAQPLPHLVRAGDAHVRAGGAAGHAGLRSVPARGRLRSPALARPRRRAPGSAALHPQLGAVLRSRLRDGVARPGRARFRRPSPGAGARRPGHLRSGGAALSAVAAHHALPGTPHRGAVGARPAAIRAAAGLPPAARLHGAVRPPARRRHRLGAHRAARARGRRVARGGRARRRAGRHAPAGLALLAAVARLGASLPGGRRPAAAAARRPRHLTGRRRRAGRTGHHRRSVGLRRPAAREEQRARAGRDARARARSRRPRRLHPAGADPGARLLPARRTALRHPVGAGLRPRRHGLARRRRAAGGDDGRPRPGAAHPRPRARAPARARRADRLRRRALERSLDGAGEAAQRRVARSHPRGSALANHCRRPGDLLSCTSESAEGDGRDPVARRL
ncbi:MAG: membrane protein-like, partial [uncultured Solirubrobacteraceae bacterium]